MANTDIVNLILTTAASTLTYLMPVIGIMTGIVFIFSWLYKITIGAAKHTFRD